MNKWQILGLFSMVIVIWLASNFVDMLPSVDTLFSGLAFAGIITTILMQKKELQSQKKQIEKSQKELMRLADVQEKSVNALDRQADNARISAELSALNTLLNFYIDKLKAIPNYRQIEKDSKTKEYNKKITRYSRKIEEILND